MRPRLDIVTVCLNSKSSIFRCINSVRKDRMHINKFIVVDGGSTDGTLDILKKNSDIISTLISQKDKGISDAFNKGILKCNGDFVLLLNSDDWLLSGALKKVCACLSINDDIVCTTVTSYKNNKSVGMFNSVPVLIPQFNSMLHPGAIVRRTIYESLGVYDVQLKVGMDYDFFCRCLISGYKFRIIKLPLVNFTEGGLSRKLKYRVFKESFYLRKKYFAAKIPLFETRQLVCRLIGDILYVIGLKNSVKKLLQTLHE